VTSFMCMRNCSFERLHNQNPPNASHHVPDNGFLLNPHQLSVAGACHSQAHPCSPLFDPCWRV
jgi:hypothetical protein